jgi:hypothetical protein
MGLHDTMYARDADITFDTVMDSALDELDGRGHVDGVDTDAEYIRARPKRRIV